MGAPPDDLGRYHPDVRPGETAADVRRRAGQEYHAYRQQLIDGARARPVSDDSFDIVSLLAHATIDDRPLDDQRLHGSARGPPSPTPRPAPADR